ncbi:MULTISPECIES: STAS domain-containing protein [Catenuloplanes]|uniref:Anti-anti-sigma factor n=1 Tax=Catenuloplanes niger TaxID=587534 RepID=A0AAE3ZM59_9ACTN|nr:STAS domain-containing protein [Catenuloplanes niger]MDR7320415.1 anti-anti-sigma factor [Catenuloplanes niger]
MPADTRTPVTAAQVSALVRRLPAQERRLLALRCRADLTEAEIAGRLHVPPAYVSRALARTFGSLRRGVLAAPAPARPDAARPGITSRVLRSGEVRVRVTGEIDRDNAPELRHRLLDALGGNPPAMTLDLAGVPLLDAAGARALRDVLAAARTRGVRISVARVQPAARTVLDVCGVG